MLRAHWPALHDRLDGRRLSVDLEEAWLIVTGTIWGTGNPVPMFDPTYRPGDNLYTNSAISWIPRPAP